MAEIPDRLRDLAASASSDGCPHEAALLERAAREIERLRQDRQTMMDTKSQEGRIVMELGVEIGRLRAERDLYQLAWARLSTAEQVELRKAAGAIKITIIPAPPGLIEAGQKITREAAEARGK